MGNNPIMMVDPEGDFVIAQKGEKSKVNSSWVQKRDIAQEGISLMPILINIRTYVKKNPHMLDVLIKFTGQSRETILSDLEFGDGPIVFTGALFPHAIASFGEILVADRHLDMIKIVERINTDDAEAAKLMLVSTLLHELGHLYGLDDGGGPNSTQQLEKELWNKGDDNDFDPGDLKSFDNLIKNGEAIPFETDKGVSDEDDKDKKTEESNSSD